MRKPVIQIEKERKIALLKKHFEVDEEKKTVHVILHYNKATEFTDSVIGSQENPVIREEVLERISDTIADLPNDYRATIAIQANDYEGYDPSKLMEALNDALELSHFRFEKQSKKKWLAATMMAVAGIVFLIIMGSVELNGWFGDGENGKLISEILDIIGWVFIWESVSVIFLSPSELRIMAQRIRLRVLSFAFLDIGGEKLSFEEQDTIFENWENKAHSYRLGQRMLLISSGAFLGLAANTIITLVASLIELPSSSEGENPTLFIILAVVLSGFAFAFYLTAGLLGLARYSSKGKHGILTAVFFAFILVLSILNLVTAIQTSSNAVIVSSIIGITLDFCYLAGFLLTGDIIEKHEKSKAEKKEKKAQEEK